MNRNSHRVTLLQIPLIEEKYGRSIITSISIHGFILLMILFGGRLLPQNALQIGSGPGGGSGGDISTVGVIEELSGGAGMVKPSLLPKPPALEKEPAEDKSKAIPLPSTLDTPKKPAAKKSARESKPLPPSNIIPTTPEPGSGGVAGGRSGGSGGGMGGGNGVSIGTGSGGFGDSYYAREVERRLSENWSRPPEGMHIEMTYSFYIAANGYIYGTKKEKSSGNGLIDMTAERAISSMNPLPPPPVEFRGRPIQFVARFIYPPVP